MCKRIFVEAVVRGWSKRKRDEGTKAGRERTRKRPCITCFKEHWIPVLSTHIFSANTYSEHSGARWNMRRNKRRASRRNSVSPFPISGHQATHPSITWAHHPQKTRSCKGHPLVFPPSFARPSISDLTLGGWGWGGTMLFHLRTPFISTGEWMSSAASTQYLWFHGKQGY